MSPNYAIQASNAMTSIPEGLSQPEFGVYQKLIGVAQKREKRGQSPRSIVVITDVGKDYDDLAALTVLKEFHRLGLVDLRAVVTNLMPADKRAHLARAALDSLGLRDIPVAYGTRGSPDEHEVFDHEFSDIGWPAVVPEQDGQDLLLNVYQAAQLKSEKLYLLCLSSLQDIHQFASTHPHLVAECTAEVHMQGGNYISDKGNLEPDSSAANNRYNWDAAKAWHSFIQRNALTSHTYTKVAAFAAPLTSNVFVELEATGHPIGAYLRRVQVEQDLAFYKRACESDPEKRFAPFMDQKWFLENKTNWHQRPHADSGDALPTGEDVIPFLTKIVLYDVHAALGVAGEDVVEALNLFKIRDRSIEVELEPQGKVVKVHEWIVDDEGSVVDQKERNLALSSLLKGSLLSAVPAETLCEFCNSINFGAAGFCGSDFDFSVLRGQNITLDKILQNPKHCLFCGKIAEFFHEWRFSKFPEQAFDLEKSSAFVSPVFFKSLEIDDKGKPEGHLICIDVILYVKVPLPTPVLFRPVLKFRKCGQHPLKVADICNGESLFDWERSAPEQAYSGRIRPLKANTLLFRKWKESCCAMHNGHCNLVFTGSRPRRLRLIDVEKRCVVDNEDGSSYVALSYVWGEWELKEHFKQMPKLTKLTEDDFRKPESLTREKVLSTIDDAIEVTRSLGEMYLWVDCLCILQKDEGDNNRQDIEADQREFISQMDSIYGFALVTIVAASGGNADAGLPGIKSNSRTLQVPFTIKGVSLLATLDPIKEFGAVNTSYLGDSVWLTRGWTLQEKIFSRRALIFTPEQVYWECQKASWCEDSLQETMKFPTIYRHSLAGEEFRHPWGRHVGSFDMMYGMLVQEYSARALSFECDGLDAFAGILHHLERQAGQSFLCALPVSLLSLALTWWPRASQGRRRILEDGTLCPFPSWSWVGWVGKIEYPILVAFGSLNLKTVGLIFYHLDDSGLPRIIQEAAATQTRSQTFVWKEDHSRTIITLKDIPESIRSLPEPSNILCFWSSAAILHVRHEVDPPLLTVSRDNGKIVPVDAWFHTPLLNPGHEELFEFVVIESVNFNADGDCLAILLVSWEDGVAYRRGLVTIEFSDWVKLDKRSERVWKMIFLG